LSGTWQAEQHSELARDCSLTARATNSKLKGIVSEISIWEGFTASSLRSSTSKNGSMKRQQTRPENHGVL
jgi:hypothetical protein